MKRPLIAVAVCAALMAACGGDGDSDSGSTQPPPSSGGTNPTPTPTPDPTPTPTPDPTPTPTPDPTPTPTPDPTPTPPPVIPQGPVLCEAASQTYSVKMWDEYGRTLPADSWKTCITGVERILTAQETLSSYLGGWNYQVRYEGRTDRNKFDAYVVEGFKLVAQPASIFDSTVVSFKINPTLYPTAKLDNENLDVCRAQTSIGTYQVYCRPAFVSQADGLLTVTAQLAPSWQTTTWVFLVSTTPRGK